MSIKQILYFALQTEVFHTEEILEAEKLATASNGTIYCWKTSGTSNWLEKGLSISDVLGLVVLPRQLPEYIEMPDDQLSEN